ncbi:MAG: hypothetical protein OXC07_05545 [Kistimonas sp.]|nr:hypothetical protein [Kistimonas sp.]
MAVDGATHLNQGIQPQWHVNQSNGVPGNPSIKAARGQPTRYGALAAQPAPQKQIHDRAVAVLQQFDTYLLNQGPGGVKTNRKGTEEVLKAARNLTQLGEKHQKLVSRASKTPQSQKSQAARQQQLAKLAGQHEDAKTALEVELWASGNNRSALDGFYDPPPRKFTGKVDREIPQLRQEAAQALQKQLQVELSKLKRPSSDARAPQKSAARAAVVAATDASAIRRIEQQLTETNASLGLLAEHLAKPDKQHKQLSQPSKRAKDARTAVQKQHKKFQQKVIDLQQARRIRDLAISTHPGQPNDPTRLEAERRYNAAEANVSNAGSYLRHLEQELDKSLKSDRRQATFSLPKSVKGAFARLTRKKTAAAPPSHPPSHKAKQANQANQAHAPQTKPHNARVTAAPRPDSTARPQQAHAQKTTSLRGEQPPQTPRASRLGAPERTAGAGKNFTRMTNHITTLSTPRGFNQALELIDRHHTFSPADRIQLKKQIRGRITQLVNDRSFAHKCDAQFIKRHFPEKGKQEFLLSLANLAKNLPQN